MHQEINKSFEDKNKWVDKKMQVFFYLINEVELSIYKFLASGAKKIKK